MRILLLIILLFASICRAGEPKTAWERIEAGEFVVFAEVIGVGDEQIAADGIEPIFYLYGQFFQEGPNGEPVDLEHLGEMCSKYDVPHNVVAIDLEDRRVHGLTGWSSDPEQQEAHAKVADGVIETIRAAQPNWKIGWFGRVNSIVPRHLNGYHAHHRLEQPSLPGYNQWERHQEYLEHVAQQEFMAKRLGDKLDWYHPSLYMLNWHWRYAHWENPTSNKWLFRVREPDTVSPILLSQKSPQDVWLDTSSVGLRLMRRTFPRKPIIPAISPQWWTLHAGRLDDTKPSNGLFFREDWLIQQLDLLKVHADGVVIWCRPTADGWEPQAFMESRRWKVICEWAEKQKAE